jgi:predicted nucleotidyltransferase component of viral defense system
MMTERTAVELFHLAFLSALREAVGRDEFVVKGGANLRFYFGSPRYSEDIDLDVPDAAPSRFSEKVARALDGRLLHRMLATENITIDRMNQAERSQTKEKWKIGLAHPAMAYSASTRVEISYREYPYPREASVVEPMSSEMRRAYPHLHLPLVYHYLPAAALEQKIIALKDRSATQPRDVFDLDILFRAYPDALRSGDIDRSLLSIAIDRTMSISYELYAAKVGAFLEPGLEHLATREHWNALSLSVVDRLEELAR